MTEIERNLDLLLSDALAENENLRFKLKHQEMLNTQLLLIMQEALRVRYAQKNGKPND